MEQIRRTDSQERSSPRPGLLLGGALPSLAHDDSHQCWKHLSPVEDHREENHRNRSRPGGCANATRVQFE